MGDFLKLELLPKGSIGPFRLQGDLGEDFFDVFARDSKEAKFFSQGRSIENVALKPLFNLSF